MLVKAAVVPVPAVVPLLEQSVVGAFVVDSNAHGRVRDAEAAARKAGPR